MCMACSGQTFLLSALIRTQAPGVFPILHRQVVHIAQQEFLSLSRVV